MAENVGSRKDTADLRVSLQLSNLMGFARILAAEVVTLIKPELVRWFDTFDQSALHATGPGDFSFVRLPEVQAMTGLAKSSVYDLMRTSNFPVPVQLGSRRVAWVRSEIQQWAEERVLTRGPNLHPSDLKYSSQVDRAMTDEVAGDEDASLSK